MTVVNINNALISHTITLCDLGSYKCHWSKGKAESCRFVIKLIYTPLMKYIRNSNFGYRPIAANQAF